MIHSALPSSPRPGLADAINQVRATGKADFLLASPLINEDYKPAASPGDLAPEERQINDIGLALRS